VGNDNNDGSTQALAFATLAAAFDRVIKTCDCAAAYRSRLRCGKRLPGGAVTAADGAGSTSRDRIY
jgi:hypothetical protein